MRIGMMADVYTPHVSGITNYIKLNKSALEKQGHEVFVFTFGDEDYHDEEPHVIRSPGMPLMDTGYYLSFSYTAEARRLLRTMDIVHVHHPFLTGSLALRFCRPRGIPIVFTNHTRYDLYAKVYLPILPEAFGETALETYMPAFCRACDLVVSPSAGMRDVLIKMGVNVPIEVVPNGVDLEPFRAGIQAAERKELGLSKDDVVFIYTGRLGPEKNLHFLLRSFAGAVQAFDKMALVLVGDGPEKEDLVDRALTMRISERVKFTGMVPYNEIHRYLAMGDAFVTASVTEVHPLSVIEAMAMGLPVLGIHSPGISDTVRDGETGFLVPEEDLAAFTAKLVRLVTDPEARRRMGDNARLAAEEFAIERTSQMMVERYQRVVERKQATRSRQWSVRWTRLLDSWR
ncbi:MAG: glycosyltransferase [Anaerolineales bacterium]|nr:glycosyltransferase [Anaerolineales bacterium]